MLTITNKAASKFKGIMAENNLATDTPVRLYLKAGGCSGFEIKVEVEQSQPGKMDLTFKANGVSMVIDKKSAIYLKGTEVDWEGDLMGGFKFNVPASTGGCGCGVSFSFGK